MAEETMDGGTATGKVRAGRSLFFWVKIAVVLLVAASAGGAVWYYFLGGRAHFASATKAQPEPPLPFFAEIKPFVVTMPSADGPSHYVQLGFDLKMTGAAAGNALDAVLPEVQDAIRQTVLGYKVDEIETPAGVDKLRQVLVTQINAVLKRALGDERFARLVGTGSDLVQNIYFSTLVIE